MPTTCLNNLGTLQAADVDSAVTSYTQLEVLAWLCSAHKVSAVALWDKKSRVVGTALLVFVLLTCWSQLHIATAEEEAQSQYQCQPRGT